MASAAAISGIEAYGLAWRLNGPQIADRCAAFGKWVDENPGDEGEMNEFITLVNSIGSSVKMWLSHLRASDDFLAELLEYFDSMDVQDTLGWMLDLSINNVDDGEEIEMIISEATACLELLFDGFDHFRVLVR